VVGSCEHSNEPLGSIKGVGGGGVWNIRVTISFSRTLLHGVRVVVHVV
jgi:hypothetical protein